MFEERQRAAKQDDISRRRPTLALLGFLGLALPGLSASQTSPRGFGDAADSVVVHKAVPRQAFGIVLAYPPYLTLGGLRDDEREEFVAQHFFLTAAHLSDGRVVVLDENSLKFFDAKGNLLKVSGRHGLGPGEFRKTRDLCLLRGDTVMVVEDNNGRLSLWTPAGGFVREYSRPPGFKVFNSCREDATLLVRGGGSGGVGEYRAIRPDGVQLRSLGRLAEPRYTSPFMYEPHVLPTARGYVVADARRFEHWIVNDRGQRVLTVRTGPPPPRMSESEWLAAAQRVFPGSSEAALRLARGDTLRTRPAFSAMRVDPLGRVWIRDSDPPLSWIKNSNPPVSWTVFDAQGAIIGRILLSPVGGPPRDIVRVGANYAVVKRIGGDGEVYLDFHKVLTSR